VHGGGDDVLSHLCRETDEHGRPYEVKAIVDHTIFLLFAAHDTSTSALAHLAMYLGGDAAMQGRCATTWTASVPGRWRTPTWRAWIWPSTASTRRCGCTRRCR
jgi:hypothetical protein